MEYTHVGHLGLVVSRLCLGTMNFGPHTPEPDSHTIMDTAVAYGINFVDTANVFGRHLGVGATEEIIGRWFDQGEGRRDSIVLATKVYGQMGQWPNESRLSKLSIVHQCEESLRRLHTDRIDLYQMHHIDRDAWWDEIWEAMDHLKQQGKIVYVGSSNFAGWHIARANRNRVVAARAGPRNRAVGLQPDAADDRARGDPPPPRYGMGLIPTARSPAVLAGRSAR
jgi:NDP-hexose 2,3-enoyl reductase